MLGAFWLIIVVNQLTTIVIWITGGNELWKALEVTVDYFLGEDTPEELIAAEDKAFFREYQRMTPDLKAKLREMRKLLDDKL